MRYATLALSSVIAFTSFSVSQSIAADKIPRVEEMNNARAIDRMIIRAVAQIMGEQHLSKHPLNDEISVRAFDQFLRSLDPMKMYFLQSDIDQLMAKQKQIDDLVRAGDMSFAIDAFKVFLKRVDERVAMAHQEIDRAHDFTIDEKIPNDRDVYQYPKTDDEARDRMRRQIKYYLLVLKSDKLRSEKESKEKSAKVPLGGAAPQTSVVPGKPDEDPKQRLHRRYQSQAKRYHQTDADEILESYVTALTTSFDPHTSYMAPKTLENFRIVMRLNLDGIGAQLTLEDGFTTITGVVPGGAADKDGRLKVGDRILSVGQGQEGDMVDVVDMKLDDVVQKIRGAAGTIVRLGVQPTGGSELKTYEITRAKISLEDSAARSEIVEQGAKADGSPMRFGYIDLPSFYLDMEAKSDKADGFRSSTRDVRVILQNFREQKVDAVVIDLSRNGGGSLTEAIDLTGLFIDRGPVVQVKDTEDEITVLQDEESGVAWNGPLIVMTSKESASASEIFAGAIQDYKRGIVVGDPSTHGKGTVQSLLDLGQLLAKGVGGPEMGALKITIQQFYLPDGKSTQRQGVMADIVLPAVTANMAIGEADLDYALPNDSIKVARHTDYKLVDSNILARLRSNSTQRLGASEGFTKLLKRIELFKRLKEEKFVTLNEAEFLESRREIDAEREEEKVILEQQLPKKEIFRKDYYSEEVLNIARDYVEALGKLQLAQAT